MPKTLNIPTSETSLNNFFLFYYSFLILFNIFICWKLRFYVRNGCNFHFFLNIRKIWIYDWVNILYFRIGVYTKRIFGNGILLANVSGRGTLFKLNVHRCDFCNKNVWTWDKVIWGDSSLKIILSDYSYWHSLFVVKKLEKFTETSDYSSSIPPIDNLIIL